MTKICGYNCEHNKGGICQITYCDKIGKMTTTTQEIEVLTRWQDPTIKEKDKEIERLKNELSIKTTYIEDVLKTILKSDDFKMQREVYEHGIEYDKKLKELKEGKENEKNI